MDVLVHHESSPYINEIDFQPPSPSSNHSRLDSNITFNPLASPSYNGSYNNSPYSGPSELSYVGESDINFPNLFDDDSNVRIQDYDPAEYDPPHPPSLLMFSDTDFMHTSYESGISIVNSEAARTQPYDYSSPSSNASANEDHIRSRASSVSSNPNHTHAHNPAPPNMYSSSPRMEVAQSFENMKFSPHWGTEPLPQTEVVQKPPSPPRLLMPEGPPTINAPDGDGITGASGPSLNIVPATPISGGGLAGDDNPAFQTTMQSTHAQPPVWADRTGGTSTAASAASDQASQQQQRHQQGNHFNFLQASHTASFSATQARSVPGTPATRPLMLDETTTQSNASGSGGPTHPNLLFPISMPRSRSKSEAALEPPNWDTSAVSFVQQTGNSAVDEGTVSMHDVLPNQHQSPPLPHTQATPLARPQSVQPSHFSPPQSAQATHGFNFPAGGLGPFLSPGEIRRSKSDSSGRPSHRQSRSEDLRTISPLLPSHVPSITSASNSGGMTASNQNQASLFYPPPPTNMSANTDLLFPPPSETSRRFLSPSLEASIPSVRSFTPGHGHSRSLSSSGHLTPGVGIGGYPGASGPIRRSPSSTRSERGSLLSDRSAAGSARVSPYPSPNASPRPTYGDLPRTGLVYDQPGPNVSGWLGGIEQQSQVPMHHPHNAGGAGLLNMDSTLGIPNTAGQMIPAPGPSAADTVKRKTVTTGRTKDASSRRRKTDAGFICPVPGCGSTFTRSFNLKGHIRSHNEERPFVCRWPGCGRAFARQHDCRRHEQLHTNYRPFICEGCQKPFARMDALNRHLRSEGGAECLRLQEASGGNNGSTNGAINGQGRRGSITSVLTLSGEHMDGVESYSPPISSSESLHSRNQSHNQNFSMIAGLGDDSGNEGLDHLGMGVVTKTEDEWASGIPV